MAYIKERYGLSMASWGLDDFGVMRELLMSESGQFAVVTTPPSGCSTAIIVTAHWERLVRPWEDADDRTVPPEQTGPQTFRKPKPYRGRPL